MLLDVLYDVPEPELLQMFSFCLRQHHMSWVKTFLHTCWWPFCFQTFSLGTYHLSPGSLWPPLSFTSHFSCSLHYLSGEDRSSRLSKQPGHPVISDSFRSNMSVARTNSNSCSCMCACTGMGRGVHALDTVHHPVSSRPSNPGLQCIPPFLR